MSAGGAGLGVEVGLELGVDITLFPVITSCSSFLTGEYRSNGAAGIKRNEYRSKQHPQKVGQKKLVPQLFEAIYRDVEITRVNGPAKS